MRWGIRSSLFLMLVTQDFQKFSKSLRPPCRPFRQAFHFGKQLCGFVFLGWQIEAAGMLVHIGERVRLFPNHRRHSRHYSLHLARVGDFFVGDLRVFCCFFHIYTRERYWLFPLVGECSDSEYLFVGLVHDGLFDPTTMQSEVRNISQYRIWDDDSKTARFYPRLGVGREWPWTWQKYVSS